MEALGYFLGKRFWADLEAHHPGIDSLRLPRQVTDGWKYRLATFSKTTRTATGEARSRHRPADQLPRVPHPGAGVLPGATTCSNEVTVVF